MYRILAIALVLFATLLSHGQTTFNFSYMGPIPPSCNPFDTPANFIEAWKPSHGSPQAGDVYGQNVFNKGRLVAKWLAGDSKEKGEGVYIEYKFLANHQYEVIIVMAHDNGSMVGLDVFATNGMTQKSNSSCGEDEIPTVSDKKEIYATNMVYDGPIGNFDDRTADFYPGPKDYNYLWIMARQYTYQATGSVFIDQVTIIDHGLTTSPLPATGLCPVRPSTDLYSQRLSPPTSYYSNRFGQSVASSGDYFIVGAPGESRAYIYKRENCEIRLKGILGGDNPLVSRFGYSVDINGDDIVVGAPGDQANGGSIYFFKKNGDSWKRVQKFSSLQDYGAAVSLDESYALVGSPRGANGYGLAIFYEKTSNGSWAYHGEFAGAENGSGFGVAVDVKNKTAIVGAPHRSNSIYLFELIWTGTNIWTMKTGFVSATAGERYDNFGVCVKLSDDGRSAYASGADLYKPDNAWTFRKYENGPSVLSFDLTNGGWIYTGRTFLSKEYPAHTDRVFFSVQGNRMAFGMPYGLIIYEKADGKWFHVGTTPPPPDARYAKYRYGASAAITENYVVLGSPEPTCEYPGAAYVYDMFAALHSDSYQNCNQSYSGTLNDVNARTVTLGCGSGSVTYMSGAKASYYGNVVKMMPGFSAKAGSSFKATAVGCSLGTIATNARVASNEEQFEETSFSDTLSLIVEKDEIVRIENIELSVFPNPSNDGNITLLSNSAIDNYAIYTLQGIPVKTFQSNRVAKNMIDVKLPNDMHGVYMIKANVDNKSVVKKVYLK